VGSKRFELAQDQTLDLGILEIQPVFPVLIEVQDEQGQPIKMGTLAVYRKRKGQASERVWGGLVQKGKVRIPGLSAGLYRLKFGKISMGDGAKGEPQESDLEVKENGTAIGNAYNFK